MGRSTPFGINLAGGAGLMVAAVTLAAMFPHGWAGLAVVALAVTGYASVVGDPGAALATAGLGFLLFTGFDLNRYGELTWNGAGAWRAAGLLAAVAAGVGLRRLRQARARDAGADGSRPHRPDGVGAVGS